MGAIKKYLSAGALIGSLADYYELGHLAADIVHKHQSGVRLEDIRIETPSGPKLVINKKATQVLNLDISGKVTQKAILVSR